VAQGSNALHAKGRPGYSAGLALRMRVHFAAAPPPPVSCSHSCLLFPRPTVGRALSLPANSDPGLHQHIDFTVAPDRSVAGVVCATP
jgi:hypothetical protein